MKDQEGIALPYIEEAIGKHNYRAYRLPMTKWCSLCEHLAVMLGKPLGAVFRGGSVNMDGLLDSDIMVIAAAAIVERLSAANMLELLDFARGSIRFQSDSGGWLPKKKDAFHMHLAQHMGEMAPLLKLFIMAQLADFFAGLRTLRPEPSDEPADPEESTLQSFTESPST